METLTLKEQAIQLVEQLPEQATWEDLMREIVVRQAIEEGLADSAAGRVKSVEEVRQRYGLQP
jgi:predicted transcriptional regulator